MQFTSDIEVSLPCCFGYILVCIVSLRCGMSQLVGHVVLLSPIPFETPLRQRLLLPRQSANVLYTYWTVPGLYISCVQTATLWLLVVSGQDTTVKSPLQCNAGPLIDSMDQPPWLSSMETLAAAG